MSVITRSALEASPLADLHAIASELGIDGFRRLRKADLVNKIIEQQGGEEAVAAAAAEAGEDAAEEKPKRTRSRGGRGTRSRQAVIGEAPANPETGMASDSLASPGMQISRQMPSSSCRPSSPC